MCAVARDRSDTSAVLCSSFGSVVHGREDTHIALNILNRMIDDGEEDRGHLISAKLVSMLILGGCSTLAGVGPLILASVFSGRERILDDDSGRSFSTYEKILSYGMLFGGGVLLSTVFMHLLPEVAESVERLEQDGILGKIPVAYAQLLMCLGFFTMFIVEELVHECLMRSKKRGGDCGQKSSATTAIGIANPTFVLDAATTENCDGADSRKEEEENNKFAKDANGSYRNYNACYHADDHNEHTAVGSLANHVPVDLNTPSLRNFLIVLALSIHEIFEGLAVGLEKYPHLVWALLTAVMCHKLVLATCVGLQLAATNGATLVNYLYVVAFALTSPLGIAGGTFLFASAEQSYVLRALSVILQGLATGTLLYIIFFEILKEHSDKYRVHGIRRVFFVIVGFAFMLVLQILLSE